MIELRGLVKCQGDRAVACGLDLKVQAGESVAIEGPSGSGKTTLLRMIAGLEHPDAGEIRLAGHRVGPQMPPHRRGLAFLFQSSALWPHLSVGENIGFSLGALGRSQRRERVAQLLFNLGLAEAENRDPSSLSGGEARRVALARALAEPRPILLLDEPTSNLDPQTRNKVLDLILAERRSNGTTTVLVSHDAAEASVLADRRLRLIDGLLLSEGFSPRSNPSDSSHDDG